MRNIESSRNSMMKAFLRFLIFLTNHFYKLVFFDQLVVVQEKEITAGPPPWSYSAAAAADDDVVRRRGGGSRNFQIPTSFSGIPQKCWNFW